MELTHAIRAKVGSGLLWMYDGEGRPHLEQPSPIRPIFINSLRSGIQYERRLLIISNQSLRC